MLKEAKSNGFRTLSNIEYMSGHVCRKNEDKMRIVLNKADMMTHQQLMRVYGALMWSLARILQNPEVMITLMMMIMIMS